MLLYELICMNVLLILVILVMRKLIQFLKLLKYFLGRYRMKMHTYCLQVGLEEQHLVLWEANMVYLTVNIKYKSMEQ